MRGRRSKPLLLASLVPAWAIVGIYVVDALHGSQLLPPFVVTWALLAVAMFAYVLRQVWQRRRTRRP